MKKLVKVLFLTFAGCLMCVGAALGVVWVFIAAGWIVGCELVETVNDWILS